MNHKYNIIPPPYTGIHGSLGEHVNSCYNLEHIKSVNTLHGMFWHKTNTQKGVHYIDVESGDNTVWHVSKSICVK